MIDFSRIQAIIFDLDGVLMDSARMHYQSWIPVTKRLGIDFDWQVNHKLKGKSRNDSLDILLSLGEMVVTEVQREEILHEKNQLFLDILAQQPIEYLPGMSEVIKKLIESQVPIAVASGSRNARLLLDKLGLTEHLWAIVDGNEVEKGKPQPEGFLKAARLIEIKPSACLVIEDSHSGVKAAIAAGMQVIGIGDSSDLIEAQEIVADSSEFQRWFERHFALFGFCKKEIEN